MIVGFRRALERDAKQRQPIRRKGLRKDGVAFDDAGIAVGGPLRRPGAVDQRNRKPAFDEMQRDRGSDDPAPSTMTSARATAKASAAGTRYRG